MNNDNKNLPYDRNPNKHGKIANYGSYKTPRRKKISEKRKREIEDGVQLNDKELWLRRK